MLWCLHKYPKLVVLQILFLCSIPILILTELDNMNEWFGIICLLITVILNVVYLFESYQNRQNEK